MLTEYTEKPIDFHSFKKLAEDVSKRKLDKYFDEWIFGNESTALLLDNEPIDSIVQRYR